uniref:Uncharacterized protein n=1 Tax=Pyxicephalus adspersus TaxID=30357 RepID=A0AAV3AUJ9_PYXAD|nr:TPA: hypothetical protein GDO54_008283 [Pyxicephalus adspersus]
MECESKAKRFNLVLFELAESSMSWMPSLPVIYCKPSNPVMSALRKSRCSLFQWQQFPQPPERMGNARMWAIAGRREVLGCRVWKNAGPRRMGRGAGAHLD